MIKALLLIFEPVATWEGIHRASRSMVSILAVYLLPLLLLEPPGIAAPLGVPHPVGPS